MKMTEASSSPLPNLAPCKSKVISAEVFPFSELDGIGVSFSPEPLLPDMIHDPLVMSSVEAPGVGVMVGIEVGVGVVVGEGIEVGRWPAEVEKFSQILVNQDHLQKPATIWGSSTNASTISAAPMNNRRMSKEQS
jgi:hypothetical protein